MKQKITLCAGLIAALAVSGHALAQPAPPPAYPGTVYPNAGLPPHEIVAMVRSTGLEPLGSPVRQGPIYAMRAVDPAGEEVRVIVDAQRGQIVKVIPLMAPRYAMPLMRPPYGRPPRPMAMVPEGYGPNPRAPMLPPGAEAPPPGAGPGLPGTPHAAGAPTEPGPPPLPRPRPKLASTDSSDAKPAAAAAPPSAPQAQSTPANEPETTGAVTAPPPPALAPVEE
ncbi:MAG: hypothetical protein ACXU9C_30010, partial [Xanthobacteraceae bacterium]